MRDVADASATEASLWKDECAVMKKCVQETYTEKELFRITLDDTMTQLSKQTDENELVKGELTEVRRQLDDVTAEQKAQGEVGRHSSLKIVSLIFIDTAYSF